MRSLKLNNLLVGLISGLLVPFITLVIFYLVRSREDSFLEYLKLTSEFRVLTNLISLAAIPDALLFFIFIWTNRLRSARGVIFSLLLISLFVIIIKLSA